MGGSSSIAGCSKRPDFSPAQPRRAKTRRSAGKAATSAGLSGARTKLAGFFNSLLGGGHMSFPTDQQQQISRVKIVGNNLQPTASPAAASATP